MQKLTTQVEAIIHYFQEMDIEMIDLILDDNKTYDDEPKSVFINKLEKKFDCFRQEGDTSLIAFAGFCDSNYCSGSCKNGYAFIGLKSGYILALIIEASNGNVLDIFECYNFKTFEDKSYFKHFRKIILKEDNDIELGDVF